MKKQVFVDFQDKNIINEKKNTNLLIKFNQLISKSKKFGKFTDRNIIKT